LLEQPYIKNDKVIVKDMVKQQIATIRENMKVTKVCAVQLWRGFGKEKPRF